jgi:hypothetical protein
MGMGDEELTYRKFVMDTLIDIKSEVKQTNGRVRAHDVAIAVLQVGYVIGGAFLIWWLSNQK